MSALPICSMLAAGLPVCRLVTQSAGPCGPCTHRPGDPRRACGQAEGGYVQGLGMMLSEDVKVDLATGKLLSDSTWTYKVPSAGAHATNLESHACCLH